jgi:hypothetical protein
MESLYRVVNCWICNEPTTITCNKNINVCCIVRVWSMPLLKHVTIIYIRASCCLWFDQSEVSSPETEKLSSITYHWFISSVIIEDVWDNRKCFTILENNWQIHKNRTVWWHIFKTPKPCRGRIVWNPWKHYQNEYKEQTHVHIYIHLCFATMYRT